MLKKFKDGFLNKKSLLVTLDSPFLDNQFVFPYLGILYLVSVARARGLRTRYVNTRTERITPEMLAFYDIFYTDQLDMDNVGQYAEFDIVGISCMTPQGKEAYTVRKLLKEKYPSMTVAIGGPHAKHYWRECQSEGFDIIAIGDGERIFDELLVGDVEKLSERILPECSTDDDQLVFQDYLTEDEMNLYPGPHRERAYLDKYRYFMEGEAATTVVNSRGCPMGCAFCEDRRSKGRWFSPEHFEREIQGIVDLGIRAVMIFDDLFAISPKKIKPYVDILRKFNYRHGLIYRCFGHAKVMSKFPEMARMLVDSGCVEIGFGAESGSQGILDGVGKGTELSEMHDMMRHTIGAGIKVKAFFMIGLPGETEESFFATYSFIKKYRREHPDYFDFDCAAFFPYKGTAIGDAARLKEGESIRIDGKTVTRETFNIRPKEGITWERIDDGTMGAYKKKGGDSDIVVETYDWKTGATLLSAKRIYQLKEMAMMLSGRYTGASGERLRSPVAEGSIGSVMGVLRPVRSR